ncbi:Protein of unknown function [Pedococcus dokdonensis]|uniref:DUF4238 domain-containing protein n=1 Tax=Pedococcus dokdonensis TaxID=443156 RepID=A0A1H0QQB3_9MICO|nr:DUF4238 domain-containing protein [Pedococcus dokdonensis]SDP18878.1 Protein of unknown function [Pedococcus dokdonensis]
MPSATNDHIVPRMYLKRFAKLGGREDRIAAALVEKAAEESFVTSTRNVGSEKGFYWGVDPDGVPHHDVEELLTRIESDATPAFRRILDTGTSPRDNAFPNQWPPDTGTRSSIAWWLAAQTLRTNPQRERVWRLEGEGLKPGRSLGRADLHLAYIVEALAPLAWLIYMRPWGFGFTNLCLFTSDSPVHIVNADDNDDPARASTYWDIYVPLDSHRFLFLPGALHRERARLMRDHFINLPGGLAIALNALIIESAHRHLLWHPDHDPRDRSRVADALKMRRSRQGTGGTRSLIQYDALSPEYGIERRWLERHTWDHPSEAPPSARDGLTDVEAIDTAEGMMATLERAMNDYKNMQK